MKRNLLILFAVAALTAFLCGSTLVFASTIPVLGTANNFAVLGGSAVTNIGSTTLVGSPTVNANLGVYPGTSCTGCGNSGVNKVTFTNGVLDLTDAVAQQAQVDLVKAYTALSLLGSPVTNDLTGKDLGHYHAGDLGALAPGVYHFDTSAAITGSLQLDAQNTDGVYWIFQIGSTLKTADTNSVVSLINAGSLNNGADIGVYWVVGSSATLGASTTLEGNILALTSITIGNSVTIDNGRALARNGAVTMDTDTISDICPTNNNGPGFSGGLVFANEQSLTLVPIGGGSPLPTIPEPGTFLLFGSGLAGLAALRKRSKKA